MVILSGRRWADIDFDQDSHKNEFVRERGWHSRVSLSHGQL